MGHGRRWLVDGMNVIGSRPDGWWRDRDGAMRALAARLAALAEESGEPVRVVFDGRPVELDSDAAGRVEVAWAGPGRDAADGLIAEEVAADPDPATLGVVTSDGALAARVRRFGVEVVPAGGFRRRLDGLEAGRRRRRG
jgi:predicted RNA-binding protein with PIN domain